MQFRVNPLTKIIGLSSVLAVGFLFIVLAGAIYGNWLTILVGFIFGVAHIPMLITKYYNYQFEDYLDDTGSAPTDVIDFGKFLSSFLVTTGVAFPMILDHCHVFTHTATVLTITGGFLIYGTVVTFTTFFDGTSDENDPFDI